MVLARTIEGDVLKRNPALARGLSCEGAQPMPDDVSHRGPADRSRISLMEPYEVQYWADEFGVSKERLSEAVRKVGHSAETVGRELKRPM
jgi:Protein of unknown function (DUF3606)